MIHTVVSSAYIIVCSRLLDFAMSFIYIYTVRDLILNIAALIWRKCWTMFDISNCHALFAFDKLISEQIRYLSLHAIVIYVVDKSSVVWRFE